MPEKMTPSTIKLRGVRVNNLQSIDLDLPKRKLLGFCGPSGSGKSSLAIDTLFQEGQRRYLETFSVSERGIIEQPEKPDADEIEGLPPAIAVARSNERLNPRVTVGSTTEILHYLQLAFSRFGQLYCNQCGLTVQSDTVDTVLNAINHIDHPSVPERIANGAKLLVCFEATAIRPITFRQLVAQLIASGYQRCLSNERVCRLSDLKVEEDDDNHDDFPSDPRKLIVIVDRLAYSADQDSLSPEKKSRLRESIETAFSATDHKCVLFFECDELASETGATSAIQEDLFSVVHIDGKPFVKKTFQNSLKCNGCNETFLRLRPNELTYHSPIGACQNCEGLGTVSAFLSSQILPNPKLSLVDGAVLPFHDGPLEKENAKLLASFAAESKPPFYKLTKETQNEITNRCIDRLNQISESDSRKTVQTFLNRFRSVIPCVACEQQRFNPFALAHQLFGKNLGQLGRVSIDELSSWIDTIDDLFHSNNFQLIADVIKSRLDYLSQVGVGYLSLDRDVNSLSSGERQRVAMTNALGSKLVNMLYVLDEPCSGLHPVDVQPLIDSVKQLTGRGNTVVVVDHDLDLMKQSDRVAEFGPGAGVYGGNLVYFGEPDGLENTEGSITGDYISGRRLFFSSERRREPRRGSIKLSGATGNNLQDISVDFPLSLLCVVTGVSGSGKSSLVVDTLYPAICRQLNKPSRTALQFEELRGVGAIEDVILVDQSPLGSTSRSNPATYSKGFDAIRTVFAETLDARTRNIKPGKFSFNSDGGRCDACKGEGLKQIDMGFLSNIHVHCKYCKGKRYKREILQVKYRDRNIADVLDMTVREAFGFFRGKKKVQSKLKPMMDVGLDYLRLGQPATTLSSGESQRLRLAGFLSSGRKTRTLFILDEPTVGLHYSDVVKLLDCYDALLAEGHSIIVVEHNKMMMHSADYLIDLGPGAGNAGGQVIATGSPEEVAKIAESRTGEVLRG